MTALNNTHCFGLSDILGLRLYTQPCYSDREMAYFKKPIYRFIKSFLWGREATSWFVRKDEEVFVADIKEELVKVDNKIKD